MTINWEEHRMGTGVETVDQQHQEMIYMLNGLLEAGHQGRGREEVGRTMKFLEEYVVKHFAHEEAVMDRHNCPAADENRRAHQAFLAELRLMAGRLEIEGPTLTFVNDLRARIVDWLIEHIMNCDAELKRSVQSEAA